MPSPRQAVNGSVFQTSAGDCADLFAQMDTHIHTQTNKRNASMYKWTNFGANTHPINKLAIVPVRWERCQDDAHSFIQSGGGWLGLERESVHMSPQAGTSMPIIIVKGNNGTSLVHAVRRMQTGRTRQIMWTSVFVDKPCYVQSAWHVRILVSTPWLPVSCFDHSRPCPL